MYNKGDFCIAKDLTIQTRELSLIVYSFVALITIGALMLMLPFSHNGELSLIDAFFTSTSAVCVTGLIVKNTPVDFTLFGQVVILLLIQIGGLGYMTAATFLAVMRRKKLGYRDRLILKESLNYPGMTGLVRFLKTVFGTILIIEVIGAAVLMLRFSSDMDLAHAAWAGVFHAVSAFNNAGFSTFETNLMGYRADWIVNVTVMAEIVLGGIGYLVISELYYFRRAQVTRISTHTKIVLLTTAVLIAGGVAMMLSLEWTNPKSLGGMPWDEKFLAALFASVNYRTAGFNSIDLSALTDADMFFSTILMVVGGSPGGTAGGVKTTALALAIIGIWYTLRGEQSPHVFRRSIDPVLINRSYAAIFIASFYVLVSTAAISEIERLPFIRTLYEVCSAFGTVGVSTGNGGVLSYSALFSNAGKINIIILMLIGRIGVLAFTVVLVGKAVQSRIKYAEGKIVL